MERLAVKVLSVAAALATALLVHARPAAADCSPPDHFAEADAAIRIVVAKAAAAPGSFRATLHVERVLKGAASPASVTVSFNPMSGGSLQPGKRYLAFFRSETTLAGGCVTADVGDARSRDLPAAMDAWIGATTPRARTAVLVKLGTAPSPPDASQVPSEALDHLGASPDLLAQVSTDERAALVRAIPGAVDQRAYGLAWTLGRLHAVESIPSWSTWLSVNHPSANARPVEDGLELMTNHRETGYTPGMDFNTETSAQLARAWSAWHAAHGAKAIAAILAQGARERSAKPPPLADAGALGLIVRDEKDDLDRRVALDVCEVLLRRPTSTLAAVGSWINWSQATAACPPASWPAPRR